MEYIQAKNVCVKSTKVDRTSENGIEQNESQKI